LHVIKARDECAIEAKPRLAGDLVKGSGTQAGKKLRYFIFAIEVLLYLEQCAVFPEVAFGVMKNIASPHTINIRAIRFAEPISKYCASGNRLKVLCWNGQVSNSSSFEPLNL